MNKQEAKTQIQRNLWQWGYKVRDMAGLADADLLVSDKYKVKVIAATPETAYDRRMATGCDVLAIYIKMPKGKRDIKLFALTSGTKSIDSTEYKIFDNFTTDRREIFK